MTGRRSQRATSDPPVRRGGGDPGFSLIELLVVITIIVVLISLLTPALDQAIYQAELARCGANLKGIGGGVNTYAGANRRAYPLHDPIRDAGENRPASLSGGGRDSRPALMPYLPITVFIDPFCKDQDISIERNDAGVFTYSSNAMWFGWTLSGGQTGMRRMGDRMAWTDPADGYAWQFDLLAGDWQSISLGGTYGEWGQHSHPDKQGQFYAQADFQAAGAFGALTYSWWAHGTLVDFSVDGNYVHTDQSVSRLVDLTFKEATLDHDDRLVQVPERSPDSDVNLKTYIPPPR